MDYLEDNDYDMDEFMEDELELDDELLENEDDMDDFFGRKNRAKRKAIGSKIRGRISKVKSRVAKTHNERKARVKKNIGMLKAIANPSFMANRSNREKLKRKIKGLAQEVNASTGMLINAKRNCNCGGEVKTRYEQGSRMRRKNRNFDGFNADGTATTQSSMTKIWTDYKIPIIVGGAVVFFFFTPYGKKMIGK